MTQISVYLRLFGSPGGLHGNSITPNGIRIIIKHIAIDECYLKAPAAISQSSQATSESAWSLLSVCIDMPRTCYKKCANRRTFVGDRSTKDRVTSFACSIARTHVKDMYLVYRKCDLPRQIGLFILLQKACYIFPITVPKGAACHYSTQCIHYVQLFFHYIVMDHFYARPCILCCRKHIF